MNHHITVNSTKFDVEELVSSFKITNREAFNSYLYEVWNVNINLHIHIYIGLNTTE